MIFKGIYKYIIKKIKISSSDFEFYHAENYYIKASTNEWLNSLIKDRKIKRWIKLNYEKDDNLYIIELNK